MSEEINGLAEEVSALKASKHTIETEVNALREEIMALKSGFVS